MSQPAVTLFNVVGFEVLTAVVMKGSVFWDVTLCSPLKINVNHSSCHQLSR
jgi:hypothetical protein